jgi:hypothetical protein
MKFKKPSCRVEEMKKVMMNGVGAQGSTIAKRLNEEDNVAQIIE